MAIEENAGEGLGEVVCSVDRSVNATKYHKITFNFNPFLDRIELDVDVTCAGCRLASICHSHGTSLSSYRIVAASCGTPKSHKILRRYRLIRPPSYVIVNSASVDEPATVGWSSPL
jgi:hypothetical protein